MTMLTEPGEGVALLEPPVAERSASAFSLARHVDNLPTRFLLVVDLIMIIGAFVVGYWLSPYLQLLVSPGSPMESWLLRVGIPPSEKLGEFRPFTQMLGLLAISAPAIFVTIHLAGGYTPLLGQSRTRVIAASILGPIGGLGAIATVVFALRVNQMSRSSIFAFWGLAVLGLAASRLGLRAYKIRRYLAGQYARNVVLVGVPAHVNELAAFFERRVPHHAYRVLGCLELPTGDDAPDEVPLKVRRLGQAHELGELLIHQPINDVVVISSLRVAPWLGGIIEQCDYLRVTVRIVPAALLFMQLRDLRPPQSGDILSIPALILRPFEADSEPLFVKRLFDIVIASALLVLLAPIFAIVAVAIKISTPTLPVFYRWRVVGLKGREFLGYKFTTMVADADQQRALLSPLNEMQGPVFKIANDPRVTRLGRFLRRYSLNELPQLWSVVKGDMSLVGPRPAFPDELGRYEYWQKRKLSVKPGITCLWQVNGRNAISDFNDWVRLDLEYIDNWSLWLDVKILIRTAGAVLRGTGT